MLDPKYYLYEERPLGVYRVVEKEIHYRAEGAAVWTLYPDPTGEGLTETYEEVTKQEAADHLGIFVEEMDLGETNLLRNMNYVRAQLARRLLMDITTLSPEETELRAKAVNAAEDLEALNRVDCSRTPTPERQVECHSKAQ